MRCSSNARDPEVLPDIGQRSQGSIDCPLDGHVNSLKNCSVQLKRRRDAQA